MSRSQTGAPLTDKSCRLVARLSSASRFTAVTVVRSAGGLSSSVPRAGAPSPPAPEPPVPPPPPQAAASSAAERITKLRTVERISRFWTPRRESRSRLLCRVVKYQAQSMPGAAVHLGYAVTDLNSRRAANALNGPLPDRNDGKRSLDERHDHGPRLAARALLDENQFTAVEIDSWPVEQEYGLKREMDLSVQVLMQAVVVAGAV